MATVLQINVAEARDLASADSNGFSDPYCVITIGAQKKKTKVKQKTLNPNWNETFTFQIHPKDAFMKVEVFDWDALATDDFLGEANLRLMDIQDSANWFKLNPRVNGKNDVPVRGDVFLKFRRIQAQKQGGPAQNKAAEILRMRFDFLAQNGENALELTEAGLTSFPIPNSLTQDAANNITIMDLSFNQFSNFPDLRLFQCLEELNLSGNLLTTLPPLISNFPKLRSLILNGNQLTAIPPELGKLRNLEKLEVGNNQVSVLCKEIGKLGKLEELSLTGNPIESIPPHIGGCSSLEVVDFSSCALQVIPEEFTLCTRLMELNLGNNRLKYLPEGMGRMTRLVVLNLMDNQLGDLPLSLGYCIGLGKLGAGISIARNPIQSEEMIAKYQIGTDHLLDYLEKRMAVLGAPEIPEIDLPADLWEPGEGPVSKQAQLQKQKQQQAAQAPPPWAVSSQIAAMTQEAPQPINDVSPGVSDLPAEEQLKVKITVLKNWAVTAVRGDILPRLKKFKMDICRATNPQDAMPMAQGVRVMKVESDKGRQVLHPSMVPGPPQPTPLHMFTPSGNEKLEALKGVVSGVVEEVILTVEALNNALNVIGDFASVVQIVGVIKNIKASLDASVGK
eukprot:TRINITY_DN7930_c0_g1_i1.p1 TRINITY_DN7930_c0_g1~~TRINITY_DN7930_c0_g1_i1.p1  ORF type:complete len:619 (-),score=165.17 TRINITY_DN7930_c0_g1_i1:9-1865(-)